LYMDRDHLQNHIESAARRHTPEAWRMAARMLRMCWPGGPNDRTEPAARGWLSRWRPVAAAAAAPVPLPACECASGHCRVCN
jgi:hypothetical protein